MTLRYEKDFVFGKPIQFGDSLQYKDLVLILIPKNCSTTLVYGKEQFRKTIKEGSIEKGIVFLRDPISRWKSGILQSLWINPDKTKYILSNLDLIMFEDTHTHQHIYIEKVKKYVESFEYYYIDDNGLDTFNNKYNFWDREIPYENVSSRDPKKLFYMSLFNKVFNKKIENLVKDFYKKDFDLIKEVFNG